MNKFSLFSICSLIVLISFQSSNANFLYGGSIRYNVEKSTEVYTKINLFTDLIVKGTADRLEKCKKSCGELIIIQTTFDVKGDFDAENTTLNKWTYESALKCVSSYEKATDSYIHGYRQIDILVPTPKSKSITIEFEKNFSPDYLDSAAFKINIDLNTSVIIPKIENSVLTTFNINNSTYTEQIKVTNANNDETRCRPAVGNCGGDDACDISRQHFEISENCMLKLIKKIDSVKQTSIVVDIIVENRKNNVTLSQTPFFKLFYLYSGSEANETKCDKTSPVWTLDEFDLESGSSSMFQSFTIINILFILIAIFLQN